MIAPVETQTLPASADEMYFRNERTSALSVNAAARSPAPRSGLPHFLLMVGKGNQLIVLPGLSAVFVSPMAMPPTKPPSM